MRLDMLTSDWHRLLKPVLPHASTDKDSWSLQAVRLELGPLALYAIATDRYTLAAERHVLPRDSRYRETEWAPVHILTGETRASLKMFTYSKDVSATRCWCASCTSTSPGSPDRRPSPAVTGRGSGQSWTWEEGAR